MNGQNPETRAKKDSADEIITQSLLEKAEISILLDTYNDIFSDFDPRPFLHRALSDDFIREAKNAARDKNHGESLDLSFMIPKSKRNFEHEAVIKRRLREHFRKHVSILENEIWNIKRRGIMMTIVGILMIMLATYLSSFHSENILTEFLVIILEPGGWFTSWTGLDEIFYTTRQKKPDLEFNRKMARAEISFHAY